MVSLKNLIFRQLVKMLGENYRGGEVYLIIIYQSELINPLFLTPYHA